MGKYTLHSKVCDILGVEYPICLAGMGAIPGMPKTGEYYTGTSIELVAAVSNAGGFGVLGAAGLSPEQIPKAVKEIRERTDKHFGIDLLFPSEIDKFTQEMVDELKAKLPEQYQRYYAWMEETKKKYHLPEGEVSEYMKKGLNPDYVRAQFDAALDAAGPTAICSGVGTSKWAVDRIHEAGKVSVSLVGNVRQAVRVAKLGTDIIVAQGTEAGGHTGKIGTLALVPQIVDAVAPIPVLAAGGIGDSRGVAAAFALGAKGVWVGTAFLASQETSITAECRQKIIDASESDTMITEMFTGKTARVIKHPIAEEWQKAGFKTLGMPLQIFSIIELSAAMEKAARPELFMLPAGQVSGLIKKVRPAKEIFDEMLAGAVKMMKGGEYPGVTVGGD